MNKKLLSELRGNYKKLYFIINRIFSIKELMGESKDKGIYCPFHGESAESGSKPSSRFYPNNIPVKLWCFQERKSYYAYHYIKLILKKDPLEYLIKRVEEKEVLFHLSEYEEEIPEKENNLIIENMNDINDLFSPLDTRQDHSKWYIF